MLISYDQIYQDTKALVAHYQSRDPREILESLGVTLLPFSRDTKLLGMYKVILRKPFVFYNPYVKEDLLTMVFAHELGHHLYHKDYAKKSHMMEYQLFSMTSPMEVEANLFAAHLLIDEDSLLEDLKEGASYYDLASLYRVDVNLMIFKLNELFRLGLLNRDRIPWTSQFFAKLDGQDPKIQK